MDKYDIDIKAGSLIDVKKLRGTIKEYQTVVAIGPMVHNINVGDTVFINPTAYGHPKQVKDAAQDSSVAGLTESHHVEMEYNFPTVTIDGVDHLFITDRDIDFIADIEEVDDAIIKAERPLIV